MLSEELKDLAAGFAGAFIDREAETRGADLFVFQNRLRVIKS